MGKAVNMERHHLIGKLLSFMLLFELLHSVSAAEYVHHTVQCGVVTLTKMQGLVTSPNYPSIYPSHVSCTWIIESPPRTVLTIRVWDLDVEEDVGSSCTSLPCCLHAWLSLPREGGQGSQQLCGRDVQPITVAVSQLKTTIKFHTSKVIKGGRGFNLTYIIEPERLGPCPELNELPCEDFSSSCFNNLTQRCDGVVNCPSGRDEADCPCGLGRMPCRSGEGCYSHRQRCDTKPDCADYSDEIDCHPSCPDQLLCADQKSCYSPERERCDGFHHCEDGSDEVDCPREPCSATPGRIMCDNGQCISEAHWCNGMDDCSDRSDEQSCIKNSVITAAIMGSLICGLLLVIAVGCMCRLYSLRLSSTGSTFLPTGPPPDRGDFFHREPPPAYSVAIGDMPRLFTVEPRAPGLRPHRRPPRPRHGSRRRAHRPHPVATGPSPLVPDTPVDKAAGASGDSPVSCMPDLRQEGEASSPPRSSSTSTSGSPSRESVTSSTSLLSYLSGNDDDTQLLVLPPS